MGFDLDNIPNQQGKIAVVTGANAGLGLETTLYLAKKGIKVVMACRNQQKAELAKANVLEKVPNANLEIMALDLSKLSSVREFAANYRKQYSSIDLLINNAGIMFAPFSKTEDEFESQMAANYFGHFLLTSLLIDLMPDSSESRVVSLSSVAHKQGMRKINFDDINFDRKYSRTGAYCQSKLACLMFALELQRTFSQQGKKILSVVAHPGASDTELTKYIPPFLANILRYTIVPFVTHTPDQAALPTLMATLDENVQGRDYYGPQGLKEIKDVVFGLTRGRPRLPLNVSVWFNFPDTYFALALAFPGFFAAARLRALTAGFAVFTDALEGALAGVGATSSRLRRNRST